MNLNKDKSDLKKLLPRFISMWPFFLVSLIFFLALSLIYLRYAEYQYQTSSVIEILDKSQDSEMALPTAMTIFNRSMINLDNEIGRLSSQNINKRVVKNLKSNIKYYTIGKIKDTEEHHSDFFSDFELDIVTDLDTLSTVSTFIIKSDENNLFVKKFDLDNELVESYSFVGLSTFESEHKLPFNLKINSRTFENDFFNKKIIFYPIDNIVDLYTENLVFDQTERISGGTYGSGSDQIQISLTSPNKKIAEEYIYNLINEFDKDGINDRRMEYKNTISFVEDRSKYLSKELELIENRKEKFKKDNKLTNISSDASNTITQQYEYDSELFISESQKDLLKILKEELEKNKYNLLPINFGLSDNSLNELISLYNQAIKQRNDYINSGAGKNNVLVKNIELTIDNYYINIITSIENFTKSLDQKILNITKKESEFEDFYLDIPKNEKILRAIQRELEIKEALYLLLLQKKEEAAINFAVVKPTIKMIDSPSSSKDPISPNRLQVVVIGAFFGLSVPFALIFAWFYLDNKIHTRDDLINLNLPVYSEIPFDPNHNNSNFSMSSIKDVSRNPIAESFRMLIANLEFSKFSKEKNSNSILITSCIKGEGKTIVSVYLSKLLSVNRSNKVILIGADLRNPQIHKFTEYDKSVKGLADYIYRDDLKVDDLIVKIDELDILFSGTIPPNPNDLLSSQKCKNLIKNIKEKYDYVIIDSAPLLLVADTFSLSGVADNTLIVCRANHTNSDLLSFIDETAKNNKLKNVGLVLNSVGRSGKYGYKYNYQYGYRYGYNYGYGYGYTEQKE